MRSAVLLFFWGGGWGGLRKSINSDVIRLYVVAMVLSDSVGSYLLIGDRNTWPTPLPILLAVGPFSGWPARILSPKLAKSAISHDPLYH